MKNGMSKKNIKSFYEVSKKVYSNRLSNDLGYRLIYPKFDEFVNSYFRESRDKEGNLNYLNKKDILEIIKDCEVIDLNSGIDKKIKIKDIVSY